jgi:hypothetical protein
MSILVLELQDLLLTMYDQARYDLAIDYHQNPILKLVESDWLQSDANFPTEVFPHKVHQKIVSEYSGYRPHPSPQKKSSGSSSIGKSLIE